MKACSEKPEDRVDLRGGSPRGQVTHTDPTGHMPTFQPFRCVHLNSGGRLTAHENSKNLVKKFSVTLIID